GAREPRPQPHRAAIAESWTAKISPHDPEGSRPACFIEEVKEGVLQEELHPVAYATHPPLVGWGDKRPVDEHRAPDHVFTGNESPVAAVFAHVAIVAHRKITVRRYDDVVALYIRGKRELPVLAGHPVHLRGRYGGEVVAVRVVIPQFVMDVLLLESLAVAVHRAIAQMNAIARDAHDPLHDKQPLLFWRQEHYDVVAADVAIRQQRPHPTRRWRELLPVHEYVVANQHRVFHGTGRNFKILQNKRHDEQDNDQQHGQRGEEFHRRFVLLFVLDEFLLQDVFRQGLYPFQKVFLSVPALKFGTRAV